MERDKKSRRVKIKTALQQVEREIALMKKLSHPNLVNLFEVIDSPESDMLYMVLEYMPLGEILTYQNDGTFRRKEPKQSSIATQKVEGLIDGHFNEDQAALYVVDILHGLAYLHRHHICHRDLKPENILLDSRGIAKLGDFGVSHVFDKEPDFGVHRQTEGTWCFWSPEMCEGSQAFSGYAADMWAAGVCLFIFVTGRLPFYSEVPTDLFDLIMEDNIDYEPLGLSNALLDLLKNCLEKDPDKRAGLGDCLQHPFLRVARDTRIRQLCMEFETARRTKIEVSEDDIQSAFRLVTKVPHKLIRSASKTIHHLQESFSRGLSSHSIMDEADDSHNNSHNHHEDHHGPFNLFRRHSNQSAASSKGNSERKRVGFLLRHTSDDSDAQSFTFDD
eukprot:Nitzschia sp. Nitz4//scaffold17_size182527//140552//141886//NITZ4_001876-RA/size182527-exonerate_protein2genome-gene-0.73-mRNA-1//-1//CDS//3329539406//6582//frame0